MPILRKRFGQHHLVKGHLCAPLIDFLEPDGSLVVEIGPGGGVLTRELLAAQARVIAVELDPGWALELNTRIREPTLRLIVGDALDLRWGGLRVGSLAAGNLPFGVSTRIIDLVLRQAGRIQKAGFMVQKEVAERILARPGDSDYGALTVLSRARSRPTLLGRVARGSFLPPPKVEAAFVGFELTEPEVDPTCWEDFAGLVHLAFSQRRKQLRNVLSRAWGREAADGVLGAAGIKERTRRAQELEFAEFLRLFEVYRLQIEQPSPTSAEQRGC